MSKTTALPVRAKQIKNQIKPQPAKKKTEIVVETLGDEIHLTIETRKYRVRGLEKNHSSQQLKVNILACRLDGEHSCIERPTGADQNGGAVAPMVGGDTPLVHLDTFDLYKARSRSSFIKATASELFIDEQTIKRDIGMLLLELEQQQQARIETATRATKPVEISPAEKRAALKFLCQANLIDQILEDFDECGLAGEATNKLVGYLACVSRRLDNPLAVLIQSGSAAGKTTLMDAVLSFVPAEDQIRYSAMTGQSLYYMGQSNLKHKILAISEEEGVAQASYALKLLQSDGKLTIAAVGKNSGTGRQTTDTYSVEGPVMMFLTTTSEHPDPELQNRCITLRVNESSAQTSEIHNRQRVRYMQSQTKRNPAEIQTLHQNAQRLLQSLPVVMPWADKLTFRHDQTRMRRDNAKYLSLIAAITLLHQHQRKRVDIQPGYPQVRPQQAIVSTIEDVELANRLVSEVMGQSLDDLLPQTRQLLVLIDNLVNTQSRQRKLSRKLVRFTQRQLRQEFGWSDCQIRHHLKRLIELEYVLSRRTGHGNAKEYELLYAGQGREGQPFLLGLVDPSTLK